MAKLSAKELRNRIVEGQTQEAVGMISERLGEAASSERTTVLERLGEVVQDAYDDFAFKPVEAFIQMTRDQIGSDASGVFEGKVAECKRLTKTWHRKLLPLEPERHARHLREYVRGRDIKNALECLRSMLAGHADEESYERRLGYVGTALGSLANDQDQAGQLLKQAKHHSGKDWSEEDIDKIAQACQARFRMLGKEPAINREREFQMSLTQAVVDMRGLLPPSTATSEITPAQMRHFSSNARAMIRTAFLQSQAVSWADLCGLFVELVPAKVSAMGAMSGVEGRLYNLLGPGAQMTARTVFKQTGEIEPIRRSLLRYADAVSDPREMGRAAETMGLLSHPDFAAFLQKRLGDRRFSSVRPAMVESVGRLGTADSTRALLDDLRKHIRAASVEGPERRRVVKALEALGEFIRSSGVEVERLQQTIDSALSLVPERDGRLTMEFALNLLPHKPGETLTEPQRRWFAAALTRALWLGEETPEFAKGSDSQRTMLGWREPIVEALERFGPDGAADVAKAATPLVSRYSGAYLAIGELGMRTKAAPLAPLLQAALRVAAMYDESAQTRYATETYYDSTDGKRKPITQKMVLAALIHGIHGVGGPQAEEALLDLLHQIQSGAVPAPDLDASKILFGVFERSGESPDRTAGKVSNAGPPQAGPPQAGPPKAGAPKAKSEGPKEGAARESEMPEEEIQRYIGALRRFHLLPSKRRAGRIAAIRALGAARAEQAIVPLIELLDNKDDFVSVAAATALKEYAWPGVSPRLLDTFLTRCVEQMEIARAPVRNRLADLLIQLAPRRDAIRAKMEHELTLSQPGSDLTKALARVLGAVQPDAGEARAAPSDQAPAAAAPAAATGAPGAAAPAKATPGGATEEGHDSKPPTSRMDVVARRREYLRLRQEWLRGGKVGPEPPRPPDV